MLDPLGQTVSCPLLKQPQTSNEINDLRHSRKNMMTRRSTLTANAGRSQFWG
jgi:hypothetical protein